MGDRDPTTIIGTRAPTLQSSRAAVDAARSGADPKIVDALLANVAQNDQSQRWVVKLLSIMLGLSMLANVVLVAFVLGRSLTVSGFGASVGVGDDPAAVSP
jgi:hypothetical protein